MIDIHCHIVYGVDDGSYSKAESLRMSQIAAHSGVTDIIATPHSIPGMFDNFAGEELDAAFGRLEKLIADNGLDERLRVHRGMEAFANDDTLNRLENGQLLTLAGTDHLLIECEFGEDPEYFGGILLRLRRRGIRPVIAHPERYYFAQDDPKFLLDYVDMGCALQLDSGSVTGMFGHRSRRTALELLDIGAVQLIGSDAHDSESRTPDMREAADLIANEFSHRYAELIFDVNPARLLKNRRLLFPGDESEGKRRDPFMTDEEFWGV